MFRLLGAVKLSQVTYICVRRARPKSSRFSQWTRVTNVKSPDVFAGCSWDQNQQLAERFLRTLPQHVHHASSACQLEISQPKLMRDRLCSVDLRHRFEKEFCKNLVACVCTMSSADLYT